MTTKPEEQTRFAEFDDATHPFKKWWDAHGQYMMSGGGRRESIWAARGWIAREQLAEGVEVTGESANETVPATPAPSQPCKRCNGTGVVRPAADNCPRCDGTGIEPAALSQSAGAREWLENNDYQRCSGVPVFTHIHVSSETVISTESLLDEYARQQTAAKDAELERLEQRDAYRQRWANLALTLASHNDHDCDWMFRELERATSEITQRAEAAERERDSLREANARLAADLNAALKAGKD